MKQMILLPTLLIFFYGYAHAEPPDTLWTRIHSISSDGDVDEGKCVRQTLDGGYIIAGACIPNGYESHIDVLLLKTDVSGNISWIKTYGGEYIEEGLSVEQTSDGGYIIGGRALFITGPVPASDHQSDAWILRTDANGDTLWVKNYGGEGNDYCTSIKQTPDLGYIMTGTNNSAFSYPLFPTYQVPESDTSRAWLIRTDSAGDTLWARTYSNRSQGNWVEPLSDGGYIITGWVFPEDQSRRSDVYLLRTDARGDILWTQNIGGSDFEVGTCVRQDQDGYVIAGHMVSAGSELYDALLIKTDYSGNVLWTKTYGGDASDQFRSVDLTSDGGFFMTGMTNGIHFVHIGDMWACRADSDGDLQWERVYDIALTDIAWSGVQTSDGGYVISGMLGYSVGGDLWLAKIGCEPTGVEGDPHAPIGYFLDQNYPNPFNPCTEIKYSIPCCEEDRVTMIIYDLRGRIVRALIDEKKQPGTHSVNWDGKDDRGSSVVSGIYFYSLKTGDYTSTRKMILIR